MKVAILQVEPKMCWSRAEFVAEIDRIVEDACLAHDPDLIVFPECMGLWLVGMEATTLWRKIWTRFLPGHGVQAESLAARMTRPWDESTYYEAAVNLQFSRPPKRGVLASSGSALLSGFPAYSSIAVAATAVPKLRAAIERAAEWVFNRLPLHFIAKRLRSQDEFEAYEEAFSSAAEHHGVHIQAGSIFVLVDEGVKNRAFVYGPGGEMVVMQEKIHPIPFETMIGVLPGTGAETFDVGGVRCGIAICYDANFPKDHIQRLADMGCRFVCCPSGGIVPSHQWKWSFDMDIKQATWARSQESGVWIGRSYNAGDLIEHVLMFQGRSSITAPVGQTEDGSGLVGLVPEEDFMGSHTLVCEMS